MESLAKNWIKQIEPLDLDQTQISDIELGKNFEQIKDIGFDVENSAIEMYIDDPNLKVSVTFREKPDELTRSYVAD
jgi:hypothetical protein